MKWKSFGRSGLKVTELCLGTMTLAGQADERTSYAILDAAFENGVRFLDTADCYPMPVLLETTGRTEELLGRWMAERGNREQLVVATKAYFPMGALPIHRGNSRRHLLEACDASLRRLKTDRIDVYFCHGWDDTVPIEETLSALDHLRQAGKILYPAISNVQASEVAVSEMAARASGRAGFAGLQPRYNLLDREAEESLFPMTRVLGLGVMVYNPIAGGLLSGKHRPGAPPATGTRFSMEGSGEMYRERYWSDRSLEETAALNRKAGEHGWSLVTAAVAWVLANPDVTSAIIGASRPEQLSDHFAATSKILPPTLKEAMDAVWYALPRRPPRMSSPRMSDFFGVPEDVPATSRRT